MAIPAGGEEIPILVTRPSSSVLRLRKPAGLAAMHLAVGIMMAGQDEGSSSILIEMGEKVRGR